MRRVRQTCIFFAEPGSTSDSIGSLTYNLVDSGLSRNLLFNFSRFFCLDGNIFPAARPTGTEKRWRVPLSLPTRRFDHNQRTVVDKLILK